MLAGIVIALAYVIGAFAPLCGVVPLMLAGGIGVAAKITPYLMAAQSASDIGPVWAVNHAAGAGSTAPMQACTSTPLIDREPDRDRSS